MGLVLGKACGIHVGTSQFLQAQVYRIASKAAEDDQRVELIVVAQAGGDPVRVR